MTFDLDAFLAEQHGGATPFEFRWGGEDWTWPAYVGLDVARALDAGDLGGALEKLFGPEQWQRFPKQFAVRYSPELGVLLQRHAEHAGSSLGESVASTVSSRSTVRPSKRTSKRSTVKR